MNRKQQAVEQSFNGVENCFKVEDALVANQSSFAHFQLIVANPPYVADLEFAQLAPEVLQYDPALSLRGGVDGLDCYRRLVDDLARLLTPGGFAVGECGAGQAVRVAEIFNSLSLNVVDLSSDLTGETRCIIAELPE